MILKRYAGIGPRVTPEPVLGMMTHISSALAKANWALSSGRGKGADQAFEIGVIGAKGHAEIYLPSIGFNDAPKGQYENLRYIVTDEDGPTYDRIRDIAASHHTQYNSMRPFLKQLMERNVQIILGEEADKPVDMVVYWQSLEGYQDYFGGTNHSLRIASSWGIPSFNLRLDEDLIALEKFVS